MHKNQTNKKKKRPASRDVERSMYLSLDDDTFWQTLLFNNNVRCVRLIVFTGGYRALGLGGKAGLKQGGYGAQGGYGTSI